MEKLKIHSLPNFPGFCINFGKSSIAIPLLQGRLFSSCTKNPMVKATGSFDFAGCR
jgi:hypothetical protein